MVKCRITQTTPHDSPGTLAFWRRKFRQNSSGITPNGCAKCRWGRLNAVAVAENWRVSTRSVVSLARSQVYLSYWPTALLVCSTFAVMQRVAPVCQRQLTLALIILSLHKCQLLTICWYACMLCVVVELVKSAQHIVHVDRAISNGHQNCQIWHHGIQT